jgi:hypothetical protein
MSYFWNVGDEGREVPVILSERRRPDHGTSSKLTTALW